MKRAVSELANIPDSRLFEEVSEGIPLIVQNAISLDEAAQALYREKQFRVSEIIRGFAEEEAAKVLILIDLIRCPKIPEQKSKTAKRFYGHVSKRIYATTCSDFRIASFRELCELVEAESSPYHLDGPNSVDWVFPNSITLERERALYVDYVRDITEVSGECSWITPIVSASNLWPPYETSDSVKLSYALSEAGANSPKGLAVIANLWRKFKPKPGTDRKKLRKLIVDTLEQLGKSKAEIENQPDLSYIVSHWPFPLWSMTIKEPRGKSKDLKKLREERACTIEWIDATNAKRQPPPAISKSKVEALSSAFAAWRREADARDAKRSGGNQNQTFFRPVRDYSKLPQYKRVEEMFCELTEVERAALLALGWYARERGVADWPKIYERATNSVTIYDNGYEIGLGCYWLKGLNRWESKPQPFSAGQLYRA